MLPTEVNLWDKNPIGTYAGYVAFRDYQKAHPEDFTEADTAATEHQIRYGETVIPQLKQDRNGPEARQFYKELDKAIHWYKLLLPGAIRNLKERRRRENHWIRLKNHK